MPSRSALAPTPLALPTSSGGTQVAVGTSHVALVLFDIDGTLISRSGPHHREALEQALWKVLSVRASLNGIPTHGMLDTDLVFALGKRAGVPARELRQAMPSLVDAAQQHYEHSNPGSLARRVCPGVRPLLRKLERRGVPLLLVTGNFPYIGWKKLEMAGLRHYFLDGAFASMASTRAALAKLAIRTARKRGWAHSRACAALVGDSPNDVHAAHANGIRSIAVCTGINTREELSACQPHVIVENLSRLAIDDLLSHGR
jgi:phosphoglycolate phosphatase